MARFERRPSRPEGNPFPPTVPDSIQQVSPKLFSYLDEQAHILRDVHNKLKKDGDKSGDWEELTYLNDEALYPLGTLVRFNHPDYGTLVARYVQFWDIDQAFDPGSPYGFSKNRTSKVEWAVTNQLSKSSTKLIIGMGASFDVPKNKQFGWVIIQGVNIQSAYADEEIKGGESLGWSASQLLGVAANQIAVAKSGEYAASGIGIEIPPGQLRIDALSMGSAVRVEDFLYNDENIQASINRIDQEIIKKDGKWTLRFDVLDARVSDVSDTFERTAQILREHIITLDPSRIRAEINEQISLTATYRHLASVDAENARESAITSITRAEAANEFRRYAEIAANKTGIHVLSVTEMRNEATLFRNESEVAAQASATSAQSAETHATNAGTSATASQTSATQAATSAGAASTSAGQASTSASQASTSASNAAGSASSASTSATNAATSKTQAANSATAAATSASQAATSATSAGNSATSATTSANTATSKAGEANTSASAAATSASNASTSATTAGDHAASASLSATAAASAGAGYINRNPLFKFFTTGGNTVQDWATWSLGWAAINQVTGETGGLAMQMVYTNTADTSVGLSQGTTDILGGTELTIDCDVRLDSGVFFNSGLRIEFYDAASAIVNTLHVPFNQTKDVSGVAPGSGTVGVTYRYRVPVKANANAVRCVIYLALAATFLPGVANAKTLTFFRCGIRPSSDREAQAGLLAAANIDSSGFVTARFEATTNAGGTTTAAVRIKSYSGANVETSSVALEAQEIQFFNISSGKRVLAGKIANGKSLWTGDMEVGGAIRIGSLRIPVALQSFDLEGSDGDTISFGTDLGNVPDLIFDLSGLAPKTATEAYDVRATSLSSTGLTLRAKILTPGTTTTQTGTGASTSGTPLWKAHKPTTASSQTGNYTFTFTGTVQFVGEPSAPSTATARIDIYADYGSGFVKIATLTKAWSGTMNGGDYTESKTFGDTFTLGNITNHAGQEFGAHAIEGVTLTAMSVKYPTDTTTSGVSSATPSGQKVGIKVIPNNG